MRKIVLSIQVTLDGFIDHTEMVADEETHRDATEVLNSVDGILFGRKTYELLVDYWPMVTPASSHFQEELEFANRINSMPKMIFSNTLNKVEWNNTTLINGDVIEQVTKLRQQPGRGILIAGSVLVNTLMQHGLFDEYRLLINPVILGHGTRLFREEFLPTPLKLIETKTFASGVVLVRYLPG
jgi:dihydrofolate reductase